MLSQEKSGALFRLISLSMLVQYNVYIYGCQICFGNPKNHEIVSQNYQQGLMGLIIAAAALLQQGTFIMLYLIAIIIIKITMNFYAAFTFIVKTIAAATRGTRMGRVQGLYLNTVIDCKEVQRNEKKSSILLPPLHHELTYITPSHPSPPLDIHRAKRGSVISYPRTPSLYNARHCHHHHHDMTMRNLKPSRII